MRLLAVREFVRPMGVRAELGLVLVRVRVIRSPSEVVAARGTEVTGRRVGAVLTLLLTT